MVPRARDPNRERAFEIYRDAGGKIDLVEIARQLNLSAGTVRGWKSKDKWDEKLNGTFQTKNTERSKHKKGAQPKNKNAVGHGAPEKNKNALKTGEFETLFFDALDPEEMHLITAMPPGKEQLLLQEIQLLTVRERRMMRRIDDISKSAGSHEDGAGGIPADMTLVKQQSGIDKDKETNLKEYQGKLGQIQAIEDALTRVQARKQKAIDSLHRFGFDDARLEIELMKLDLTAMKMGHQDTEAEDDGFLDALNAESGSLWSDADG